jgi:TonB family protein
MKPRILLLTLFLVLPSCCLAAQQNPIPDSKQEGLGALRLVSQSQVPEANKNGYSYPKCIDCPQAQYTREALAHKFQGTMTLILVVTPQGRAKDIKVLKALPYGLTESAIEAVKKWKFKPAAGPDGKPAAVRQKIWITFYI